MEYHGIKCYLTQEKDEGFFVSAENIAQELLMHGTTRATLPKQCEHVKSSKKTLRNS